MREVGVNRERGRSLGSVAKRIGGREEAAVGQKHHKPRRRNFTPKHSTYTQSRATAVGSKKR